MDFNFSGIETFEELKKEYFTFKGIEIPPMIVEAYEFAFAKHDGQLRVVSGKPYVTHCLTVAVYTLRLGLDDTSIAASLIHDTVEDTDTKIDEIEKLFGIEVAFIVDALTIVTDIYDIAVNNVTDSNMESEVFLSRKIILKASEDIRVIMIKLCDKMHNLLTQSDEKKASSARRVKMIWEPLAEYVGLYKFKRKFQDEVFRILDPINYKNAREAISIYVDKNKNIFKDFLESLQHIIDESRIEHYQKDARIKTVHSFYEKLKRKQKNLDFSKLDKTRDIFACRVLVESIQDCYLLLGLIHGKYEYFQEEYDDYIVRPKANGYRSIQTMISFGDIFIEVQIKTFTMHEFNEYGPASHITYKNKAIKGSDVVWMKEMSNIDMNKDTKINVFAKSVFVFTPKGKIIRLDEGSNPLDFAYHVHTSIGNRFLGAKVNGKIVEKEYKLKTGEVCEILTGKVDHPKADWIKQVKMSHSRSQIRRSILKLSINSA